MVRFTDNFLLAILYSGQEIVLQRELLVETPAMAQVEELNIDSKRRGETHSRPLGMPYVDVASAYFVPDSTILDRMISFIDVLPPKEHL